MFQRVLVPLDGSSRAEQALPVAARIVRASGGKVVLLRVANLTTEFETYSSAGPAAIQTAAVTILEAARNYLQGKAGSSNLAGVQTETEAILGQEAAAILSAVDTHHIDLIAMCSHGYTGMTRWIIGSVAEKVAHRSPVPVLMLREGGPTLANQHPPVRRSLRALVPLDGSAQAITAIVPAAQLIGALSAPAQGILHLTQVVIPPVAGHISYSEREAILQGAREYLSSTVEAIREGSIAGSVTGLKLSLTWSVTIDDDIAGGIIRVAESGVEAEGAEKFGPCDVIAMATHGYGDSQQWVMGSITDRVLQATRLPLLIVRPPKVE